MRGDNARAFAKRPDILRRTSVRKQVLASLRVRECCPTSVPQAARCGRLRSLRPCLGLARETGGNGRDAGGWWEFGRNDESGSGEGKMNTSQPGAGVCNDPIFGSCPVHEASFTHTNLTHLFCKDPPANRS